MKSFTHDKPSKRTSSYNSFIWKRYSSFFLDYLLVYRTSRIPKGNRVINNPIFVPLLPFFPHSHNFSTSKLFKTYFGRSHGRKMPFYVGSTPSVEYAQKESRAISLPCYVKGLRTGFMSVNGKVTWSSTACHSLTIHNPDSLHRPQIVVGHNHPNSFYPIPPTTWEVALSLHKY